MHGYPLEKKKILLSKLIRLATKYPELRLCQLLYVTLSLGSTRDPLMSFFNIEDTYLESLIDKWLEAESYEQAKNH